MGRNPLIVAALTVVLTACAGPGRGITGNDTGGIIPYSPAVEGTYRRLAADHCGWHRLSHVITSVHRRYGDYISFVCMDRPGVAH